MSNVSERKLREKIAQAHRSGKSASVLLPKNAKSKKMLSIIEKAVAAEK